MADDPDGGHALVVQAIRRTDGTVTFSSVWWPPAGAPIVLHETGIRDDGRSWEFRHEGLWAELVCETPFEHWSYGLEAFALRLDDPEALLAEGYGERVPFGFEMDFVADTTEPIPGPSSDIQSGRLGGLLLSDDDPLEMGRWQAHRVHWWDGDVPALAVARSADAIALPDHDRVWWVARDELGSTVALEARP